MKAKKSTLLENTVMFTLLALISALFYLPWVGRIGFLNDDWYLMYSAHAYGPTSFVNIFSVDRPVRALVMMPAYTLFGDNAVYYNLSAYAFRLISALAFLWLLRMLWPRQRSATFLASLLFLIYPGFLSQLNGIDYQSQIVSLAAAMLSIALTVRVVQLKRTWQKIGLIAISTLLGWFYLGLVEYFLGFEYLRLASLFLLSFREHTAWRDRLVDGFKRWFPNIFTPLVFLTWRLFFFISERGATDVSLQLKGLTESPLITLFWWFVHLATNSLDVLFSAWIIPFSNAFPGLRFRYVVIGLFVTLLTVTLIYRLSVFFSKNDEANGVAVDVWKTEMLFIGLTMVFMGLVPVVFANREVSFPYYSRYALASSAGAVMVLIALLFMMPSALVRWSFLSLLIAISVFTHHATGLSASNETRALRDFWWQVSWRVPQFEQKATLIANYPIGGIAEDYFVWGPANLIYYADRSDKDKIRPVLFAAVMNNQTRLRVLSYQGQKYDNRKTIVTYANYRNFLILSRPSTLSCVHLIDGAQPEISAYEDSNIVSVASYSDAGLVKFDQETHVPPQVVFGPEPAHDWCYYYEKASLARQRGDWDAVLNLADTVFKDDLVAQDQIEWIPFLQAYTRASDLDHLTKIKHRIKKADPYVFMQVCKILRSTPSISAGVMEQIEGLYCMEQ